jgi:hypothetical protein
MGKAPAIIFSLLLIAALMLGVVGCGSGSKNTTQSQPSNSVGDTIDNVQEQAYSAAREANLRIIDTAIQQYYAENGNYPTSLSQLSQFFSGGVPSDPAGGQYYITTENGVAKAAVR